MVDDDTLALVDRETRNFFPEARLFEHRHESGLGTLYGPAQAGYEPAYPLGDIRRPLLSPLQDSIVVSPLPPDLRRHAVEASRAALGAGQGHVRDGPGNAAVTVFAKPDIYEYLEERRVFYAIRLPSNKVLQWEIAPLLIRPVGRPPKRPVIRYDDFWYRAWSWDRARRVVAKVEWHRGELFPRVGFIVTNMTAGPEGVVRFYNGRGTAEQWIKEGKYALNWTRLSCHRFVANPGASVSVRPGVQPWELPSPVVSAQGGQALVAAERAGQADQDGSPCGAARPVVDLSVVRGVGSSTVVRGSAGSYRPVIAGAKLREGTTTILPRGGERSRESPCLQCAFTPLAGDTRTMKTDKKGALRLQAHLLLDRPAIDWPCRT